MQRAFILLERKKQDELDRITPKELNIQLAVVLMLCKDEVIRVKTDVT